MACVEALSCRAALTEATQIAPKRSRASDGICASAKHTKQNSRSDHENGEAFDVTHDPANGFDAHQRVTDLVNRGNARIKYVISRNQIWNPLVGVPAAFFASRRHGVSIFGALRSAIPGWRPYTGSNPHNKHAHVSIKKSARGDLSPWWTTTMEEAVATGKMVFMRADARPDKNGRWPFYAVNERGQMYNYNMPDGYGIPGLDSRNIVSNAPIIGIVGDPTEGSLDVILCADDGGTFQIGPK